MMTLVKKLKWLNKKPTLSIIQVGEIFNSSIESMQMQLESEGINCDWYYFPEDISDEELEFSIKDIKEHSTAVMVVSLRF